MARAGRDEARRESRNAVFAQQWQTTLRPHPWRFILLRGVLLCGVPMAAAMWSVYFIAPPADQAFLLRLVWWCMPLALLFGLLMGAGQWVIFAYSYRRLAMERPVGHHAP